MSYSVLAGLPPIYGLFAGLMPMFSYSFFGTIRFACSAAYMIHAGTSKELSVGPAAMVSLTLPSAIESLAGATDSATHQEQYAALSGATHCLDDAYSCSGARLRHGNGGAHCSSL